MNKGKEALKTIKDFFQKKDNLESSIQIKGIVKSEYPILYRALEKNMVAYNIKRINVKIVEKREVNAFAISLFRDSIEITKRALEKLKEDEIEAIVAHEFSHLFNRDSILMLTILLIFSLPLLVYTYINRNSINNITPAQSIIFFIYIVIFQYGFKVLNWVSVFQEIRSDREAVLKTKNPKALVNALLKIYIEPFENSEKPSYLDKIKHSFEYIKTYFYGQTHPVSKERLEYLDLAKKMLKTQKTLSDYIEH